jgi:hypothetical protein
MNDSYKRVFQETIPTIKVAHKEPHPKPKKTSDPKLPTNAVSSPKSSYILLMQAGIAP